MTHKNIFSFLFLLLPFLSQAQLTVVPSHPAAVLASKLAGPGITISSPVLTCAPGGNGTFTSVATPIIIDSGIILSSGLAVNTAGLETFLASTNNSMPGDAALTTLAGTATNDACILEFDFVPKGDTVSFNYQFGSEEYINSTCGQYNDAFAFFISGPGIVGAENMAIVPGTTNIPVTVNSINSGVPGPPGWPGFCNIANCTAMGPGSPFTTLYVNNLGGTAVTYRGYTTKLRAYHSVTPCSTYHLKMSVADAANSLYDSGVFIEAGSLTTNTYVFRDADSMGHTINGIPHAIVRGCAPATITVLNSRVTGTPQKVYFTYGGTAIHGTDFTAPDSANIAPGDTSVVISITGNPGPVTGPQSIIVYLSSPYSCGIIDTVTLTLLDAPVANITTPDTAICIGQSFQIRVSGTPGLVYNWSPAVSLSSATAQEPFASPVVNTIYTVTATLPLSGCTPIVHDIAVDVNMADMHIITPDTTICKGESVAISVHGIPGLVYTWNPGTTLDAAYVKEPTATPVTTTTYSVAAVSVSDGCQAFDQITITVVDPVINIVNPAPSICYGTSVQFMMSGDASYTSYSYHWEPADDLDDPDIIEPTTSSLKPITYTVTATVPVLGCVATDVASVSILPRVIAEASTPKPVCINEPANLYASPIGSEYSYSWTGPDGFNSVLQNPYIRRATLSNQGIYSVVVTNTTTGCFGTDTTYVIVGGTSLVLYNVTEDQKIPYGSSIRLNANGGVSYTWLPNDGSLDNHNVNNPLATPTANTSYVVIAYDSLGCKNIDTVHITVEGGDDIFVPSAFTPNGDGLNDIFRIARSGNFTLLQMDVYDRWGNLVFHHTTNDRNGWDGTYNGSPAPMGTYYYTIYITDEFGNEKIKKGDVTLIR